MKEFLYVVDPMCAWCWGFGESIAQVRAELPEVPWRLVMGGLARDSEDPMDEETAKYVQQAWLAVAAQTGAQFNHDFWTQCSPRRSTYPSCRAVILAGQEGKAQEMLSAIQQAYYSEARNPSDLETLTALAEEIGMNPKSFRTALEDPKTQVLLEEDFSLRRSMKVTNFPSVGLRDGKESRLIISGWCDAKTLSAAVHAEI
ncbi:MAG: DsbA family protein [Planctomycetota bacterium]|nr:DsbA family protein [Planctomycetota bacterium]